MNAEQSKFAPALSVGPLGGLVAAFVANNDSNTLLVSPVEETAPGTTGLGPHAVVTEASKCAPALAVFDGKLWMAFVANNDTNTLLLSSSPDGVNWTREKPPNESSKCSPALAGSEERLYLAFVADNDSNDLLVTSTDDGMSWTRGAAPNESSKCGPALSGNYGLVPNEPENSFRLWMAFVANNDSNDLLITESIDGGMSWQRQKPPNESSKFAPALAAVSFETEFIAFVANNDTNTLLITKSTDGGNSWVRQKPPNESSKDAPSAVALGGDLFWLAFVANNDTNTLLASFTDDGGSTWNR
jgi:hypothetical protein